MRLVVGLGNPGPRYARNRHNIGFMAVDEIVRRHSFATWRSRFQARVAEGRIGGEKLLAMEPQTYMNLSGQAVGEVVRFFNLEPEDVIVLHDDIDLKPGKVRVKQGGGHGGHNGLRSIDSHIGKDYRRVRLGVGHPGDKDLVHDYVLHDFAKADDAWLDKLLDAVAVELPLLVAGDDKAFMSRVNQALAPPRPKPPKPKPTPESQPELEPEQDERKS
ncbi:MAG: aminoacyl-tRNA hydrolase [Rhodospirillales bacterium]|nr:aminoacyl-tRNA hydrolase [Rhodospirillales bacterium]